MSTNSIFILKPIWDALYEDAKKDREEMDALKRRIADCDEGEVLRLKQVIEILQHKINELEAENACLKSSPHHYVIDDAVYAAEADAPTTVYSKPVNEVVIVKKEEEEAEETKTVKMVGSKTKKDYQKEYQRAYREKRKQATLNV